MGLPIANPNKIPKYNLWVLYKSALIFRDTPLFTNANRGITMQLVNGTSLSWSSSSTLLHLAVYDFDGIDIASSIPLIVGWILLNFIKYHKTMPPNIQQKIYYK